MKSFAEIYRRSLKEGTWKCRPDDGEEAVRKIEELKDWMYDKFGDDHLFDKLDGAIKRIKELAYNEKVLDYLCVKCRDYSEGGMTTDKGWNCSDCLTGKDK